MSNTNIKLTEEEATRLAALWTAEPSGPAGPHLTEDEFAAYPAGLMPAAEAARIERHLAACEECAEAVEFLFEEEARWDLEEKFELPDAARTGKRVEKSLHFRGREILCVAVEENGNVTVRLASTAPELEDVEVRVRLGNYGRPVKFERIGNGVGAELRIPHKERNDPGIEAIDLIDE